MSLEIRLFGPGEVFLNGELLPPLRARAGLKLLALLALSDRTMERARLAATLWPDSDQTQALYNLRRNLVDLRQALGDEAYRIVSTTPRTLQLELKGVLCDVREFEKATAEAAVALYRGPFMEGSSDEWVLEARSRFEMSYLSALEALSADAVENRQWSIAEDLLRKLITADPFRESAYRALMASLAAAGETAKALAVYQDLETCLLRELRSEPSQESQALVQTLKSSRLPARAYLPVPLTSFVGRLDELSAIRVALQTERIVTLTGPGGVGKTRLSLELVGGRVPTEDVRFVDLAPVREGSAIAHAIASSIGVQIPPDTDPIHTLCSVLEQKSMLLILDNAEQVAESCALLVTRLLRSCPSLRILCTSRQPLFVPGEKVCPVKPLESPPAPDLTADSSKFKDTLVGFDAAAMLLDRVALSAPSFVLTDENAVAVASLCRQLDGLPLALELVAVLFRSLSVSELVTRLESHQSLLGGGDPTVPRQQTLQAALDWSYDLLTGSEQTLLRRLSVFSGGWTLEAAEVICAEPSDSTPMLNGLVSLVDKSLVVREEHEEGRYRLLVTTREYAEQRMETSERESIEARHAEFYRKVALRTVENGEDFHRYDWLRNSWLEGENFRIAHAWYLARDADTALWLEFFLYNYRVWPVQNAREWIARLIREPLTPSSTHARVTCTVASWAVWLGDPAGEQLLNQALRVAGGDAERIWQIRAHAGLAEFEEERGDEFRAFQHAEAALASAKALGEPALISEYDATASLYLSNSGRVGEAQARVRSMIREQTWHSTFYGSGALGQIAISQGQFEEALAIFGDIVSIAEQHLPASLPNLWRHHGQAALGMGDLSAAWRFLEEALRISERIRARDREGWIRFDMAEVAFQQRDVANAWKQLRQCLLVFDSIREPRSVAQCLQRVAAYCVALGQYPSAATLVAGIQRAFREHQFITRPESTKMLEDLATKLRSELSASEWEKASKQGAEMSLLQALTYALTTLLAP